MNPSSSDLRVKTNLHVFFLEGEATGAPGLRAACCNSCGRYSLGRVLACSHCLSRDVDVRAAGQHANVVEFAISDHPAGGFEAPYAIAQIQTREGMTLLSPLVGDASRFARGAQVHFVLLDRDDGRVTFAYEVGEGSR